MLAKRIIPCLDIKDGRTVKGINFVKLKDAGDPVALAMAYNQAGADELVFLDINASHEQRKTFATLVRDIALHINIPFTVGGGVGSVADVGRLLEAGADKVCVNSAAVKNPGLLNELSRFFGSQCIVLAVDAKWQDPHWIVHLHGGRIPTERHLTDWVVETTERGAGEILFTSMDHDGTKNGFALEITDKLAAMVPVPIIASGGAGNSQHFAELFEQTRADAGLAASIFHFGEIKIPDLKHFLIERGIPIRPSALGSGQVHELQKFF